MAIPVETQPDNSKWPSFLAAALLASSSVPAPPGVPPVARGLIFLTRHPAGVACCRSSPRGAKSLR